MTMTNQDPGGGGGGTASTICAISPSDQAGIFNNLIDRIQNLELAVSQMLGANVSAGQLSDISSQVGWVGGITYMGIPGWTQTEYGSLIPPPGFTLSDIGFQMFNACTGEYTPYQGVVMDENGVLQFGWTPSGNLCGEAVEAWNSNSGATQDYAAIQPLSYSARGVTVSNNTLHVIPGYVQAVVSQTGLYMISSTVAAGSGGNAFPMIATIKINGGNIARGVLTLGGAVALGTVSLNKLVNLNSGDEIMYLVEHNDGPGVYANTNFLNIVRVSN